MTRTKQKGWLSKKLGNIKEKIKNKIAMWIVDFDLAIEHTPKYFNEIGYRPNEFDYVYANIRLIKRLLILVLLALIIIVLILMFSA